MTHTYLIHCMSCISDSISGSYMSLIHVHGIRRAGSGQRDTQHRRMRAAARSRSQVTVGPSMVSAIALDAMVNPVLNISGSKMTSADAPAAKSDSKSSRLPPGSCQRVVPWIKLTVKGDIKFPQLGSACCHPWQNKSAGHDVRMRSGPDRRR